MQDRGGRVGYRFEGDITSQGPAVCVRGRGGRGRGVRQCMCEG